MSCPRTSSRRRDVVAGPATGGALLAHTVAGLLDGRRADDAPAVLVRAVRRSRRARGVEPVLCGAHDRASGCLIVDDVRNTGTTFKQCADLVAQAGGTVIGTDADHRSLRGVRQPRSAERVARGIQGAAELSGGVVPDVRGRCAGHDFLIAEHRQHDTTRPRRTAGTESRAPSSCTPRARRTSRRRCWRRRRDRVRPPARTTPQTPRRQTGLA